MNIEQVCILPFFYRILGKVGTAQTIKGQPVVQLLISSQISHFQDAAIPREPEMRQSGTVKPERLGFFTASWR